MLAGWGVWAFACVGLFTGLAAPQAFRCSRRLREASPSRPSAAVLQRWIRLTLDLRRLAFKRRQWAYLGHWLQIIKKGGRLRLD